MMSDETRTDAPPPPSPPPWRGVGVGKVAGVLVLVFAALAAGVAWSGAIGSGFEGVWSAMTGGGEEAAGDDRWYTCGMHPWVILPDAGDCPICHMDLVPVDPAKLAGELAIDPTVVRNIGVRVEPVVAGPLVRTIRTVGTVAYDETRVRDINTRVSGWVEELYVDYEGARVERGEPLFELYSRELYSAQREYLGLYESRGGAGMGSPPGGDADAGAGGAGGLLEAARTRLKLFGISDEQIEELEERGEARATMTIRSPYAGVVTEKRVNEGMRVEPGMRLYEIVDLSEVWVMASVYGDQLAYVEVGQPAAVSLPSLGGRTFEGEVAFVDPYVDARTRQVEVRIELANPGGVLRPGMYAEVVLRNRVADRRVLAPRSAVIDTGEREVAFVALGRGRFEPREVDTGVLAEDGMVAVEEGLEAGEKVVVNGQFLLDSEARVREAMAKMMERDEG